MSTTDQKPVKISIMDNLEPLHVKYFHQLLQNILSTDLAERTFAQIIDGLPTRDDVGYFPTYSHEIKNNSRSSSEAMKAAKVFRENINVDTVEVDGKVIRAYQNTVFESREFYMRLLELLAIACHDIAALLYFNTEPGLRRKDQDAETRRAALQGRPTDFMHEDYFAWEQYPNGIADVVGYWAEYHLFGGVVLFDRGESGVDCKSAFLHPVGGFRIFQLSDTQIYQFSEYTKQLVEAADGVQPPFPFRAEKYAYRVDPFDAMALNIYRNRYERKIPRNRPARCVQRLADFPELADAVAQVTSRGHGQ